MFVGLLLFSSRGLTLLGTFALSASVCRLLGLLRLSRRLLSGIELRLRALLLRLMGLKLLLLLLTFLVAARFISSRRNYLLVLRLLLSRGS